MNQIEKGVFDVPFIVSPSLKKQEKELKNELLNAQRRIFQFASKYGWEHLVTESFMDQAEIYDNQKDLINRLRVLTGIDESFQLPETIAACLEERHLLSISPSLYKEIYAIEQDTLGFEKLLAHEIGHRLHVRILKGHEEKMGPPWFFEGFALFSANQFPDFNISDHEILDIILNNQNVSYRYYAAVFRYLVNHYDLKQFIQDPETIINEIKRERS